MFKKMLSLLVIALMAISCTGAVNAAAAENPLPILDIYFDIADISYATSTYIHFKGVRITYLEDNGTTNTIDCDKNNCHYTSSTLLYDEDLLAYDQDATTAYIKTS
ncbi:MAG: hypothetical protein LBR15_00750 [Methanobrevibacter sp.]|jgi:hypothetical protein|nr:hypothetical protein [Candidatus Methanovirga australis]